MARGAPSTLWGYSTPVPHCQCQGAPATEPCRGGWGPPAPECQLPVPLPLLCPQNLLRVGSALLDAGNKRHWELIQQTEGGTAQLLRHFEEYARALARNMPQTYLSPFTIVTPNIGQWGHAWPEGCERGICLGTWACWGHACALGVVLGTWAWMCLGTCVCSGDVCVLGTWTRVWEHRHVHTWSMCVPGHVCAKGHTCAGSMDARVYLGTCAGDMDICVSGKCVLWNMGVSRGTCVPLGT